MKEQLISLETAKLAKEKGFKAEESSTIEIQWSQDCDAKSRIPYEPHCFLNGEYFEDYLYSKEKFKKMFADKTVYCVEIQIPTQSLLQKWLRERNTPIIVTPETDFVSWYVWIDNPDLDRIFIDKKEKKWINSYEEALEVGLQEALKLI